MQVQGKNYVLGTGFVAHFTNALWTNAHVVQAVLISTAFIEDLNPRAFAVKSGTAVGGADTYWLERFWVHPAYDGTAGSPDAALLTIDANLTQTPFFLPRDQVQGLQAGQPIGTIGFLEELSEESVNVPIATFKDGTISSLRPFADEVPTPANSRVIQHNLDLSGRTSGNLIFDHQGYIIAMNFAGIFRVAYDQRTGKPTRVVNENPGLALRVDELWAPLRSGQWSKQGRDRIVGGRCGGRKHGRPAGARARAGLSARILPALPGWLERRGRCFRDRPQGYYGI